MDNGPNLFLTVFMTWSEHPGLVFAGFNLEDPDQNIFIDCFNGSFREEVLNAYVFADLDEVRQI